MKRVRFDDDAAWSPGTDFSSSPVLSRFMEDSASRLKVVIGPVGSGKTRACVVECGLRRPAMQAPDARGVRRFRLGIVRATYPQLLTTTLAEWLAVFPRSKFPNLRETPPMQHDIEIPLADGTRIELTAVFLSAESPEDEDKLLSLNATGFFFNEIREIPKNVVIQAIKRCRWFPPKDAVKPTWGAVVGDTNPPYDGMWLYDYAEGREKPPETWKIYRQPPAVHEVEWRKGAVCPG